MFFKLLFLLTLLNTFIESQYTNDRLDSSYINYASNYKEYPNYINSGFYVADKAKVGCDRKPNYYYDPFTYACLPERLFGETCSESYMCNRKVGLECVQGKCVCSNQAYSWSTKLYSCVNPNVCSASYCGIVDNLQCSHTECICDIPYVWNPSKETCDCLLPYALSGGVCVGFNGAACSSTLICKNFDHFECILGFCQCIAPFIWDSFNQLQPCQCKLPYILASNGQCVGQSGASCSTLNPIVLCNSNLGLICQSGTCQCTVPLIWTGSNCACLAPYSLQNGACVGWNGAVCSNTLPCDSSIQHLMCISGHCQCVAPWIWNPISNVCQCIAPPYSGTYYPNACFGWNGAFCSDTIPCDSINNLECISGFCRCVAPWTWNEIENICECISPYSNEENPAACGITLGWNGAICTGLIPCDISIPYLQCILGHCQCIAPWSWVDNQCQCWPPYIISGVNCVTPFGGYCTSDAQCDTANNMICDLSTHTCGCLTGGLNSDGACEGSECTSSPDTCTIAHTQCIAGYCQCIAFWTWNPGKTACVCLSPNIISGQDCVRQFGSACLTDSQCDMANNFFCDPTTSKCVCKPGYTFNGITCILPIPGQLGCYEEDFLHGIYQLTGVTSSLEPFPAPYDKLNVEQTYFINRGTMTIAYCKAFCQSFTSYSPPIVFKYYGIWRRNKCACGFSINHPELPCESCCNSNCYDKTDGCGGVWAMNIYSI